MQTFCYAGRMNHIVERLTAERLFHLALTAEVELYEVDALVLQELSRTATAHHGPCLHTSAQGFLDDKRADEAARSCDKYLHVILLNSILAAKLQ